MEEELLITLLKERKEKDSFDFKGKLRLYEADGTLVKIQRDELIKDILGLANGNSHIIRETKYLIVGVDDNNFDEHGIRTLYNVDYKTPSQKDLMIWLNSACSPSVVGVKCETVLFRGNNLFVITIPPTFEIHETTRELNASGHFQKHVVFMRQDENTVPASVREGIMIQQRKHLHRQEVDNPPAVWIGSISGGIVALLLGVATFTSTQPLSPMEQQIARLFLILLGIFLGGMTGFVAREWNGTRYAWRYMKPLQKIIMFSVILLVILIGAILIK